jgi:hypothetical protein
VSARFELSVIQRISDCAASRLATHLVGGSRRWQNGVLTSWLTPEPRESLRAQLMRRRGEDAVASVSPTASVAVIVLQ